MKGQRAENYTRLAVAILVSAIVLAVAALAYSSVETTITRTSTSTLTTSLGGKQVGNCTVTNYTLNNSFVMWSTITVTSGSSTFTGTSFVSEPAPTVTRTGTGYQTTMDGNETGGYTLVSTSTGATNSWIVTACTFV
jgi:hypothetical protein